MHVRLVTLMDEDGSLDIAVRNAISQDLGVKRALLIDVR